MKDITYCTNNECLLKYDCLRFLSNPINRQVSTAYFKPVKGLEASFSCIYQISKEDE